MHHALVTWSDRGVSGPAPSHHGKRPDTDRGPVLRLLEQDESRGRYERVWVLSTPAGEARARELASEVGTGCEVRVLDVDDPSDHALLFRSLGPFLEEVNRAHPPGTWSLDVLLSAGTPQAQTLWVILVQSGLLRARMLQVIPASFVPVPHPRAVREVRLDVEGFPEIRALRDEVARLRAEVRVRVGAMVGESEPMRALLARVVRVAAADLPTLILGETGTGKELVARAIHDSGPRAKGPFLAENCGAFSEGVLASELFGHEPGAFTGATGRRRGLFEQAHGGTLFLDEVGELDARVQTNLLRVLQDGTLRRVGGDSRVRVDVRVLAATHRDLSLMVREGRFREDLYYRLRGATLEVPPLRERPGDLPLLVSAFLDEVRARRGGRGLTVTRRALASLEAWRWPGNVRELRAEVLRWGVFCDDVVDEPDLSPELRTGSKTHSKSIEPRRSEGAVRALSEVVAEAERGAITAALEAHGGNLARTARALVIDRNTLKRKLAGYGLRPRDDEG